jgi:hypothetical protein
MIANLFFLFGLLVLASHASSDRVLQSSIQQLTFVQGQLANRVRTPVQPKLQCIAGSAKDHTELHPQQIQCVNKGADDTGAIGWSCEAADMSDRVRFLDARVRCEGYERAGDPYVRTGSCIVQYTLDLVTPVVSTYHAPRPYSLAAVPREGGGGVVGSSVDQPILYAVPTRQPISEAPPLNVEEISPRVFFGQLCICFIVMLCILTCFWCCGCYHG